MSAETGTSPDRFEHCKTCPSPNGCSAASYCVMESRFHYANQEVTAPVCATCDRSARGAWACTERVKPCDAQSELWGQWFLVQMYAADEKRRRASGADAESPGDDDWDDRRCDHEHDEECYDYQGFFVCSHTHCWNCGGCGCPGYCDDYQTYNLRPAETGGTPEGGADQ